VPSPPRSPAAALVRRIIEALLLGAALGVSAIRIVLILAYETYSSSSSLTD
jgi:hypothetical protein